VNGFRRNAMALTMLDKKAVAEDRGEWPAELKAEFERESRPLWGAFPFNNQLFVFRRSGASRRR